MFTSLRNIDKDDVVETPLTSKKYTDHPSSGVNKTSKSEAQVKQALYKLTHLRKDHTKLKKTI